MSGQDGGTTAGSCGKETSRASNGEDSLAHPKQSINVFKATAFFRLHVGNPGAQDRTGSPWHLASRKELRDCPDPMYKVYLVLEWASFNPSAASSFEEVVSQPMVPGRCFTANVNSDV